MYLWQADLHNDAAAACNCKAKTEKMQLNTRFMSL